MEKAIRASQIDGELKEQARTKCRDGGTLAAGIMTAIFQPEQSV